jgi:hypothetical protein
MDLKCINKTNVFADWLDVTCSPDDSFLDSVQYAIDSFGAVISTAEYDGRIVYKLGDGYATLIKSTRFHKVSVSGTGLHRIRELGKLDYFLTCISEVPHSITRLDASLDTDQDGADVFAYFSRRFHSPSQNPKLSRKAVTPSYISSLRDSDGRRTGTVNIGGYKNTKVSARIYDKQHEALQKRNQQIPPTTRYELTVRKDMKPSLRDVSDPTAIFWHYMGKTVLKTPEGVPEWSPNWGGSWTMEIEKPLLYQVLKSKAENNPEFIRFFELADSMSPDGRTIALNMLKHNYLESRSISSKTSA